MPHLQRLSVHTGTSHRLTTTVGDLGQLISVRLSVDGEQRARYTYLPPETETNGTTTVRWAVNGTHVRLMNSTERQGVTPITHRSPVDGRVVRVLQPTAAPSTAIALDGQMYVELAITFETPDGETITYRQEVDGDTTGERARLLWPGPVKICRGSRVCGRDGMYVPGGDYPEGNSVNTTIRTDGRSEPGP